MNGEMQFEFNEFIRNYTDLPFGVDGSDKLISLDQLRTVVERFDTYYQKKLTEIKSDIESVTNMISGDVEREKVINYIERYLTQKLSDLE